MMAPLVGYWHSAAGSTSIYACLNGRVCRSRNREVQEQLVQCQQAWYTTIPPGQKPLRLPDGRLCLLNASMALDHPLAPNSSLSFSILDRNQRRRLSQAGSANMSLPPGSWISYTELQCTGGATGPLCGACLPGRYITGAFSRQNQSMLNWHVNLTCANCAHVNINACHAFRGPCMCFM